MIKFACRITDYGNSQIFKHEIVLDEVNCLSFCYAGDEEEEATGTAVSNEDESRMTTFSIKADRTAANGLSQHALSMYNPISKGSNAQYIVFEFREDSNLRRFLANLTKNSAGLNTEWSALVDSVSMNQEKVRNTPQSLIDQNRRERRQRLSRIKLSSEKSEFVVGKKDTDILLIFPFAEKQEKIEAAVADLVEVCEGSNAVPASSACAELEELKAPSSELPEKGAGRDHFLTIDVNDYERLYPGVYLNDTLIDFWMKW
jgi:hypothetical protein